MTGDAWLFFLAVLLNAANLFLQVFFSIMYSDLEVDYINPIDLCNRLNVYILPEACIQLFVAFIFLVTGHWFVFLINVPLAVYNIIAIWKNQYLLDATEIFRTLSQHKKESFSKLGFHLVVFFVYLYLMILALVSGSEDSS